MANALTKTQLNKLKSKSRLSADEREALVKMAQSKKKTYRSEVKPYNKKINIKDKNYWINLALRNGGHILGKLGSYQLSQLAGRIIPKNDEDKPMIDPDMVAGLGYQFLIDFTLPSMPNELKSVAYYSKTGGVDVFSEALVGLVFKDESGNPKTIENLLLDGDNIQIGEGSGKNLLLRGVEEGERLTEATKRDAVIGDLMQQVLQLEELPGNKYNSRIGVFNMNNGQLEPNIETMQSMAELLAQTDPEALEEIYNRYNSNSQLRGDEPKTRIKKEDRQRNFENVTFRGDYMEEFAEDEINFR